MLKYVLYVSVIGIPLAVEIRRKQSAWNRIQAQTGQFLSATSSSDDEFHSLVKGWNSKSTQKTLKSVVSSGISDDLKERLTPGEISKYIKVGEADDCSEVLESLRRDHTRGCIAQYTLKDETTGAKQLIAPDSENNRVPGDVHFGEVLKNIKAFNKQGNLDQYSTYIQALMCQNILQGLIYKQKSELQAGAWKTKDSRKKVLPDYSCAKPCETGLANMTLTIQKGRGSKPRTILVEGNVQLKSNLHSNRAIDVEGKGQLDFEEPSRHYEAKMSFELTPKSFQDNTFTISNFSVRTILKRIQNLGSLC